VRNFNVACGGLVTAAAFLMAGCGAGAANQEETPKQYEVNAVVAKCGFGAPQGTNVEPTYVPGKPDYSPATDPNLILAAQAAHPEKYYSADTAKDVIGLNTIVCETKVGKPNWAGDQGKKQVLTQLAVQIALQEHLGIVMSQSTPSPSR
jgi:hypothetical protein